MNLQGGQYLSSYTNSLFDTLTIINGTLFFPLHEVYRPFTPPANAHLLYKGEHFQGFPAYMFEGIPKNGRNWYYRHKPDVRLYGTQ